MHQLQNFFLKKTNTCYDRIITTNGYVNNPSFLKYCKILDSNPEKGTKAYAAQIEIIINNFKENKNNYDGFLILDSDAFPVKNNWLELLIAEMKKYNSWYASPSRIENFDHWPHMCCLFILREHIEKEILNLKGTKYLDLNGIEQIEIGAGNKTHHENKQIWLPLLRTNIWNPHPIVAGIYSHLFYHHGAGSRSPVFRVSNSLLYKERKILTEDVIKEKLFKNPKKFINELTGNYELTDNYVNFL